MGYPGDRQPRRQPYQPYETPRQTGDLQPETEPRESARESGSWPVAPEPGPDQPSWARADERQRHSYGDPAFGGPGDPTFGLGRTYGTPRSAAFPEQAAFPEPEGDVRHLEVPRARGAFTPPSEGGFGEPPARDGAYGEARGGAFEPRESGPLSGRQAQPRPFEDLGRHPFEPPARQQGAPFATTPPQSGPFPSPPSQTGPFPTTPPRTTGSFESTRAQAPTASSETGRPWNAAGERAPYESGGQTAAERGGETAASVPPPPKKDRRSEPEPGPRTSRAPLFVLGGIVGLVAVIVAGVFVMSQSDTPAGTAAPSPGGPTAQAPVVGRVGGGKYGFAASRKSDPQPLTINEVFGDRKITVRERSYLMTVRRLDKKCKEAVHGTEMQKVLTAGKCTQFLRASFRDAPGKLIGTVGVANLSTAAGAKKAAKVGTGGELEDYVNPLQGKDSATKLLGSGGESYATAWPHGHYLVLMWFQYKDGHKPSKAELKRLNRAAMDITDKTVFSALDTRALTGARGN
ncbi:hypothetical protein [Sphaerisporangium dianthi]|uniref:Uncharacterized protein n=1 Tax=Sphaerisporangium dianthi TaxID=1436120 RepID=A0ABV9CQR2_9ACTN